MQNVNVTSNGGALFTGSNASFIDVQGNLNFHAMRPFIGDDGHAYANRYKGGDPKAVTSYSAERVQRNGTLRRDEWKHLDEAILSVASTQLDGVQDLIDNNLIYDLGGNGMASTVLETHTKDRPFTASLSMDGVVRGENDRPNYETVYTPLPITHVDYEITARELANSRKLGNPLNVDDAVDAARAVMLKREQLLFTDTTYAFGGGTIYSYINHPRRNTVAMGTNWASDTTANILTDVLSMMQALVNVNQRGPFGLYYPRDCVSKFNADYSASGASILSLRNRVLQLEGMKFCKVCDTLPTGNAVMVNLQTNTVRLVRGMGLTNLEWSNDGGMLFRYKVMAIEIPQIRADASNQCGVAHCAV